MPGQLHATGRPRSTGAAMTFDPDERFFLPVHADPDEVLKKLEPDEETVSDEPDYDSEDS